MKSHILCKVQGCTTLAGVAGVCYKHYKQLQRHGKTGKEVSAKLIDGKKLQEHPLYNTWRSFTRVKCGTQVCEAWLDFEQFVHDVPAKPDGKASLRRLDTSKLFEPNNVFWYTTITPEHIKKENARKQKEFRNANPDYARWKSIKSNYGLSQEEYLQLSTAQNNLCAICKCPETRTTKTGQLMNLHVDHNHASKAIRGLLCHKCNAALGLFNDNIANLQVAIDYLQA